MPYIYFIHEEGCDSCFKMGKTENHPEDRMRQLQTGNPRRLLVYRYVRIDDHSTAEEYLHCKYSEVHIRGEWYNISRSVVDEECAILSENIDNARASGAYERTSYRNRIQIKIENARRKGDARRIERLCKKIDGLDV